MTWLPEVKLPIDDEPLCAGQFNHTGIILLVWLPTCMEKQAQIKVVISRLSGGLP